MPHKPTIRRIALVGPQEIISNKSYGGGVGGYTRNLNVYLRTLGANNLKLQPFYHSVRGQPGIFGRARLLRAIYDSVRFLFFCLKNKPNAVHVLAQYRDALPRELAQLIICKIIKIKYVYDIKAGSFVTSYTNRGIIYKFLSGAIIRKSDYIFTEGISNISFIEKKFSRTARHLPNFVPCSEIPQSAPPRLTSRRIRLLFVGFCSRDKGVFELVEGANIAASAGVELSLELIGAEAPEFSNWVTNLRTDAHLDIVRFGRRDHAFVLDRMAASDIYIYPTNHPGEGHNNSINEAMMGGMPIICTQAGFLSDILRGGCAYFLESVSGPEISKAIQFIHEDRDGARSVGLAARNRLIEEFTDESARATFHGAYNSILD